MRTHQENIARVVEHLVAFENLLFNIIGFQQPVIGFVAGDGFDSAQNAGQIAGPPVISIDI